MLFGPNGNNGILDDKFTTVDNDKPTSDMKQEAPKEPAPTETPAGISAGEPTKIDTTPQEQTPGEEPAL